MKSFTDLNNYAQTSVSYSSALDYSITWSSNAGPVTIEEFEGAAFEPPKQIQMLAAADLTRDVLITITPSDPAAIAYVQYLGSDSDISVASDGVGNWTVLGVRTVAQYDDVFDELSIGITPSYITPFDFTISLDDQMGDEILSWTVSVTVLVSEVFIAPEQVNFTEDQNLRVANIAITENFLFATNYSITISTEDPATARIAFAPGNVPANTWTVTNASKSSINSQLANLVLVPGADFTGNTYFDTSVTRVYDSETTGKRTLANCVVTHAEFSSPSAYGWSENSTTQIGTTPDGNLRITDLAQGKNYSTTITISPASVGNLFTGNTSVGNTVTFTGNKTTVNNNLSTVSFQGNSSNKINGNVQYQQTQTTDGIVQGNITIPLTYQIPAIHIFSNIAKPFGTRLASTGAYEGGNATANVDFWAYQYNTSNTVSGGRTYLNYTTPSTANINLADVRSTSSYKYAPISVRVRPRYGIMSRMESRADGTAGYIGFWMKPNINHKHAIYGVVSTEDSVVYAPGSMYLHSYDNNMYWSNELQIYQPAQPGIPAFFLTRIALGPNPAVDTWTHFALQISAGTPGFGGTQVVSVWRNGVPITEFRQGGSGTDNLQTGNTWQGKTDFKRINGFKFGANVPVALLSGFPGGFNDAIGRPAIDILVDDIVVRSDAPYTNLAAFTPAPVSWGGNVTQMVTGI